MAGKDSVAQGTAGTAGIKKKTAEEKKANPIEENKNTEPANWWDRFTEDGNKWWDKSSARSIGKSFFAQPNQDNAPRTYRFDPETNEKIYTDRQDSEYDKLIKRKNALDQMVDRNWIKL